MNVTNRNLTMTNLINVIFSLILTQTHWNKTKLMPLILPDISSWWYAIKSKGPTDICFLGGGKNCNLFKLTKHIDTILFVNVDTNLISMAQ